MSIRVSFGTVLHHGTLCLLAFAPGLALADELVRADTRADVFDQVYGLRGTGVTVAILDRGIDWRHEDFRNEDGTTRIRGLLDLTGQVYCTPGQPSGREYTETEINAALAGAGVALNTDDFVGHGTVTAGLAAGNGRAGANGKYRGLAPGADLLIVKVTSDGVPAFGTQPGESAFVGCLDQALDWVDRKMTALGQPGVAIINSGVQWGPMDGSSAVSRAIERHFPANRRGRIYVAPAGDEGALDTHAGGSFSQANEARVRFELRGPEAQDVSIWYPGTMTANVSVALDDGTVVGPVGPNQFLQANGVQVVQYSPGTEFYPWTSTSGDRGTLVRFTGKTGRGEIRLTATSSGEGRWEAYATPGSDLLRGNLRFLESLAPGRLADFATTRSAIVVGVHVNRDAGSQGAPGELWIGSPGGPTRDGRVYGVDVTAPGHNAYAAYGANSYWTTFIGNLAPDGNGRYGLGGATSGSAPIVVGAVALLLELDPSLDATAAREILRATARRDAFTGPVPNPRWGYGKLDMYAAALETGRRANLPGVVEFTVDTLGVSEADGSVALQVRRIGGSGGRASVPYATTSGTAEQSSDFEPIAGTLTWDDGDSAPKSITIRLLNDTSVEAVEEFKVSLVTPTGARLGPGSGVRVRITSDDLAPLARGSLGFTSTTASVSESAGTVSMQVTRTGGSDGAVSVSYATAGGTAAPGTDFQATTGTLNWADGDATPRTITVAVVNDSSHEATETFTIGLSSPTGGAALGNSLVTVTITDDDPAPPPAPAPPAGSGGGGGGAFHILGVLALVAIRIARALTWRRRRLVPE